MMLRPLITHCSRQQYFRLYKKSFRFTNKLPIIATHYRCCETLSTPTVTKDYSPKVEKLADDIVSLTLIETADLNQLLKTKLNIQDTPMMMGGMMAGGANIRDTSKDDAEEDEPAPREAVQTSFAVKLSKFDESKKVALIKELKSKIADMNLVQAKKLVESAPVNVKENLSKEEAEKLLESLKAAGGECTIV